MPCRPRQPTQTRTPTPRRAALAAALTLALLPATGGLSATLERPGAPGQALKGSFVLSIGGLTAARLTVDAERDARRYEARAAIETAGMVRLVRESGIEAEVEGSVARIASHGGLAPERYRAVSRDRDERRRIAMDYAGRAPSVSAEPAYGARRWELDPATQTDALDPLSALLAAFGDQPRATLCDREIRVFDARRRFAVTLEAAGAPSPAGIITCEAAYRRLGGFKPKMLAKPPFPFTVSFAEGENGLWQLVRAEGETPLGPAVMAREQD